MATIERKISGGKDAPFRSVATEIVKVGGVEEEFLFAGTATQFRLADGAQEYAIDGRWLAEPMSKEPFRSRMLVVRPGEAAAFNGSVIVFWNNVSMGHDLFMEKLHAAQLVQDGFALVGVTTQRLGIDGESPDSSAGAAPVRPVTGLRAHDPARYGTLAHPGDGYSYDIFTQAAELVGPGRPRTIDPMGGFEVAHRFAMGASQSASRLATYLNAVQPLSEVFDAFLLNVYAGCPCALDPATAPATVPQAPINTFQLLPCSEYFLRDDVGLPVIVLNSECELEVFERLYQPDTDMLRFWEIAGTAHFGWMSDEAMAQTFRSAVRDACRVSFAPANRSALHGLQRWLEDGTPPPHQPRLQKVGDPPVLPRDEHGNAMGGVRWPDLEAPLGTYLGAGPATGLAHLMGRSIPFPPEKIRALYGGRDTWLSRYREATQRLVDTQVMLSDDAARMVARAATMDIGI